VDGMIKSEFTKHLDNLFKSYFFKKKGNQWTFVDDSVLKIIKLRKSYYGNYYYIDYGFILKSLELDGLVMHIYHTLGSSDEIENARIMELLDFDSSITDEKRIDELKNVIEREILALFRDVNTEDDILKLLKRRRHLNDIPLCVKEYFKLPAD
jgi:hypothetical protein